MDPFVAFHKLIRKSFSDCLMRLPYAICLVSSYSICHLFIFIIIIFLNFPFTYLLILLSYYLLTEGLYTSSLQNADVPI